MGNSFAVREVHLSIPEIWAFHASPDDDDDDDVIILKIEVSRMRSRAFFRLLRMRTNPRKDRELIALARLNSPKKERIKPGSNPRP